MKKYRIPALASALVLAAVLSGCGGAEPPAVTDTVATVGTGELPAEAETLSAEDSALVERAADILRGEYDLPDREHLVAEVSRHVSNGEASVTLQLWIGGYRTWESYTVYFSGNGSVKRMSDMDPGEYSRYPENATPEAVAAAKASLKEQLAPYDQHSGVYLSIDEEGYLCLSAEVIVDLVPPLLSGLFSEGGCGIDHEHRFFNQRICPAP